MRKLAGTFDPHGRADTSRTAGALAPEAASIFEHGPLRVAHTGAPARAGETLCLLDGFLDNADALAAQLGGPAPASPEALLGACWRRWGVELPGRMRGDFALLVWDPDTQEGLLARDQLGVRSLFLCDAGGALYFADEVRHLLALLPRRAPPDPVGVAHWVAARGRPGSGTLYAGVRRLQPGGVLRLDRHGAREQRYWEPRFREPLAAGEGEFEQDVREAIGLAVRRRLSPTATTGVLMSGGLDSSAVAASAAAQAPGAVSAFCGVFPRHPAVDESEQIAILRGALQLPGITAEVEAGGLLASALESQRAWDVPLVGWGDFWTLPLLRKAAGAGVDTMLGGDGGDELFGPRSYLAADYVRAGHARAALGLVRRLPGAAYGPSPGEFARVAGNLCALGALPYRTHELLRRPFAARAAPRWLRPRAIRDLSVAEDPLAWKRLSGPRWWAHQAHLLTRGPEELGVFEALRRGAAPAGLEARHPLFDLDLVELVLRGSPLATFDARMDRPVLRASMAGMVPDAVRLRRHKALFDSLIVDSLLGVDGASVRALLAGPSAEIRAFVDMDAAERALLAGGQRRPFQATQYVWRLLTAECWLKAQADPAADVLAIGLGASLARVSFHQVVQQRERSAATA
jgi:asparagine synthase (glutamine-hydrolysing)